MKRKTLTPEETAARRAVATKIAELAGERFKNLYGSPLGQVPTKAFVDWIVQEATDIDTEMLSNDVKALAWQRECQPNAWDKRKAWLNPPKGKRMLKALLNITHDARDAMKTGVSDGTRMVIDGTDTAVEVKE